MIPYTPEILPKINHIVFTLISFLYSTPKNFGIEEINYVRIIKLFAKYSPFLIKGKRSVTIELLLTILNNCY